VQKYGGAGSRVTLETNVPQTRRGRLCVFCPMLWCFPTACILISATGNCCSYVLLLNLIAIQYKCLKYLVFSLLSFVCVCVCVCLCVCMYVCMYVCIYVCMYVCVYVCMHVYGYYVVCAFYICMYVYMYIYVCVYIYIYIYVYVYIHIYTHRNSVGSVSPTMSRPWPTTVCSAIRKCIHSTNITLAY
jgi:hypothetical protein